MAGDWLKMEIATPDKPEIWLIADALGIDPDAVVGKLFRVWCWFDQHTELGNAPIVTETLLDRQVNVIGFVKEMIKVGWLVEKDGFIQVVNFERHNGKTSKKRAVTAKRVANYKDKTLVTPDALPKEEKRRYKKDIPSGISKENAKKKNNAHKSDKSQFDLQAKDGTYRVSLTQLESWTLTYPDVDVERQLRRMAEWCKANAAKRKTCRGMTRFITSWLARSDDEAHKPVPAKQRAEGKQTAAGRAEQFHETNKAYAARALDSGAVSPATGTLRPQVDGELPDTGDPDTGTGGMAKGALRVIG